MINLQRKVMLLINLHSPKFLKRLHKPFPYFFMVNLLHRLYDVDASAHNWRLDPQPIFMQNGSNGMDSRKDAPLQQNCYFSYS